MYEKTGREKIGRIEDRMNQILATCEHAGRRGLNASEREEWARLEQDHSQTTELVAAREGGSGGVMNSLGRSGVRINETNLEQFRDEFRLSPAEKRRRENDRNPHVRAFSNYLRRGMERLDADDRVEMGRHFQQHDLGVMNVMSTTTTQGGYLIPQGFSETLEEAKKWFGGIEGTVGKFSTGTGNPWPWPTVNDTTNKGRIIGQNVQVTETDLTFGQVTFNAYIGSSDLCLVPLALMEDSYFDLETLIARLLGIRLGRLFNNKCTVGTGTNEPTGLITAATTAGNILTLGAGNTASIAYVNLVDLEHLVDPAYRNNPASRWMFSDTMLKLLKKLVDTQNRPLWQPGLTASFENGAGVLGIGGAGPKMLDHEYIVNTDMAVPAADAYSMVFGDLSTFKVREVAGGTTVLVLRERYADYLQVGFIAFQRFDSNLIDAGTHPIALLQQSHT